MKKQFEKLDCVISNPYIGFTSFQHFRGEKLYSDCITGNSTGVAGCETENYECYPVTTGVEEKGREQGYYPDNTVAYIRILWKEFEPKQGEYNYAFIEKILADARAHDQTVMFRLMPHSTCARDDVPDWLKELMPCPERPDGMRVKDSPTDPRYMELFGKAIERIGSRFDKDETLDCVDVSLGGAWGEGHQGFPEEAEKALMDIYVRAFPNTKLIGQCSNANMLNYIYEKRPIGWRSDGTGHPKHAHIWFPSYYPNVKNEHWRTAPISFESYWWISEWYRQGWDIDEIIEFTLSHHISTFNTKSIPIQYELQPKIESWLKKMGYRFELREIEYPETVKAGEKARVTLRVANVGVAPIYNALPLKLRLKGAEKTVEFTTDIDVRKWLPGEYTESAELSLPCELPAGEYEISLALGGGDKPAVQFASKTGKEHEWHVLAKVTVEN